MINTPIRILAATLLLAVAGCGDDADKLSDEDGLLRYVPADAPYAFAKLEPLPGDLVERLEPATTHILDSYRAVLQDVVRQSATADSEEGAKVRQLLGAVDELLQLFTPAGLEEAGIGNESQFALYGNGLLPVMRIEVASGEAFDAAVARIESKAGHTMSVATVDGSPYRYVDVDRIKLILGVFEDNAVLSVIPASFDDEQLKRVLGLTLPEQNIVEAGTLAAIGEQYGFLPQMIGYFSGAMLADAFLEQPTGVNADLFALTGFDPASVDAACRDEIRAMVAAAPRLVFGYDEISADTINSRAIVETRDDIASAMTLLTGAVPGLGVDEGSLMSMGFSFDIAELRNFADARLAAVAATEYQCDRFEDLAAGAAMAQARLAAVPIPPNVLGFQGFNLLVDDIAEFDPAAGERPEAVDATVMIQVDNAPGILMMGQSFLPQLAAVQIEPDGKPVAVDPGQLQGMAEQAFVALDDDTIVLSAGADAESKAARLVGQTADGRSPFFALTLDAERYYRLLGDSMVAEAEAEAEAGAGDGNDLTPAGQERLRDIMYAVAEIYDQMAVSVDFTAQGVEIATRMSLADE